MMIDRSPTRAFGWRLLLLNILGIGAAAAMIIVSSDRLQYAMSYCTIVALKAALFCIVLGLLLSWTAVRELLCASRRTSKIVLAAILFLGLGLLVLGVPRVHRINFDEVIYENIGQSIAWTNRAFVCNHGEADFGFYKCFSGGENKQPNGMPFLISLVFGVAGVNEWSGFLVNNILYLVGVVVVFLLGRFLFESEGAGLWSAAAFAFTPQVLIWSNTASADIGAGVTIAAAILALLLFLKEFSFGSLLLCTGWTCLAINFRTESPLIVLVLAAVVLMFGRQRLTEPRFYSFLILLVLLCLPQLIYLWTFRGESWGSTGEKFALEHFLRNIQTNGLFYLQNREFPLGFSVLALIGLVSMRGAKSTLLTLWWFLCFWGVFLFFYAGSYDFGADVRYSTVSAPAIALLAGAGAQWLVERASQIASGRAVVCALVSVLLLISSHQLVLLHAETEEGVDSRFDIAFAGEFAEQVPPDSIVFSHNPSIWLVRGKNAAQTSVAVSDQRLVTQMLTKRYGGGVYFHFDYWCNTPVPAHKNRCQEVLETYEHQLITERRARTFRFALYRLSAHAVESGR